MKKDSEERAPLECLVFRESVLLCTVCEWEREREEARAHILFMLKLLEMLS